MKYLTEVIIQGEFVIIPNLNNHPGRNPELGFVKTPKVFLN